MRCGYCYNGRKLDRRMPLETALRGVDLLSGARPRLTFFGGEPLLELELMEKVVGYTAERCGDVDLRVVTNGTLLAGAVSMLTMVPSVVRCLRRLISTRGED